MHDKTIEWVSTISIVITTISLGVGAFDTFNASITPDAIVNFMSSIGVENVNAEWAVTIFLFYVLFNIVAITVVLAIYKICARVIRRWLCRRNETRMQMPSGTNTMKEHARTEYDVELKNDDEAAILTLVACGKDTIGQLVRRTGICRIDVEDILKRLRRTGLVDPVKIEPIASLGRWAVDKGFCVDDRSK